jgi:prepilin signal peptidase PulO-like enzyme (type II secretory pathway)
MYRLRRFGVVRTATVVGLMYALLVGIILIPILLLVGAVSLQTDVGTTVIGEPGSDLGTGTAGAGALGIAGLLLIGLLAAVLYGIVGWVLTAIVCLLYNLVARWTGGIEVEVVQAPPPEPVPTWGPTGPAAPVGPGEPQG